MKLFGLGNSRSFRALWALEESGLDYDYVAVSFGSKAENGTASEAYQMINKEGKVPTLTDGDFVITESGAIVNYIAACSANAEINLPSDLKTRAKYDEVCYFVLTELEQGLWTSGKHRFALPEDYRVAEIMPTAKFEFNKAITTLQYWFDGEGYILGDKFSMADILLAHTLNWAESFKFEVPVNLLSYKNRMYERKACLRALEKCS